jgi:predicted aspartyl protease
LGGKPFTVESELTLDGVGVKIKALADTGANGYLFLNRPVAKQLSSLLKAPIQKLPYSVSIRGYNGGVPEQANQFIRLHLNINKRRIRNCPLIVLDLGQHIMIIGNRWLKHFRILLDPQKSRLIWPADTPPTPYYGKDILIPLRSLHQKSFPLSPPDTNRRTPALEPDVPLKRPDAGILNISPPDAKLIKPETPQSRLIPRLTKHRRQKLAFSIHELSANAMHFQMKKPDTEFFLTSIAEIDRILDDRKKRLMDDQETANLIDERLPKCYDEYRDVFSKVASDELPPHRVYDHKITLTEPLPAHFSPLYRQSTEELQATKEYLQEHLKKGFIANSNSPFASPVLFVKKAGSNKLRFCIDYRKLNALTRNDPYPIPRIDELLSRITKAVRFTKVDIRQAFHRIRMSPESEEMTTFRTRYGMYKCKVLPFGLSNGPATYQRYMNDVLMDYLDDFCTAYLDDILIYSENEEEHETHVKKVLSRLRSAGLQADINKSEFHVTRTKYLGYILTTEGIEVDPEKVEVLKNWVRPTTVTGVKSYLGFCGFYRQFIENFGKLALPLTKLTRPSEPFLWTSGCEQAFQELKDRLLKIQALHHFHPELPTKLETDASDGVIAGILSQQHPDQKWYPIAFYSHVLVGHESNWEIHDKELYAIVEAFKKWRPEFQSVRSRIEVFTDHKSLEYFMTTKVLTSKQVRWMEFLSDFNFRIMYTTGKSNQKADILSRREQDIQVQDQVKLDSRSRILLGPDRLDPRINSDLASVFMHYATPTMIATMTPEELTLDSDLIRQLRDVNKSGFIDERKQLKTGFKVTDDLLLYKGRLCVERNTELCTKLIREVHDQVSSAHPSARKTYQLIAPLYYWNGMGSDCKTYVANCRACRISHPRQTKQQGFLHPLKVPDYPMQHLCMDFKSFPKDKHGYDAILVFICRLGKDSVSIPCHKTTDAEGLARLFIQWIYRFGHCPESITSDRGPQFVSSFWSEFCRIIGVKLKLSTAYHKQTDGQTEIMNRYIDQRLRPFISFYQDNWSELIPLMDRVQMTLPHASIGMTPYRLKFGLDPRTSWDWNTPNTSTPREKLNFQEATSLAKRMHTAWVTAQNNMTAAQARMERSTNQHRRPIDWAVGDKVYLSTRNLKTSRPSRKLAEQWTGPYEILEKVGHSYKLKLPEGSLIHDVFAPDVLAKDPNTPLPGQVIPPPPAETIEGELEWEVQDVLASRLRSQRLEYQVKWVGHDTDPTWYPADNFEHSPHKLRDFHARYPEFPGPPRNLSEWITAWENHEDK